MKASIFPKLAFDGIRKNRRMYYPFILTQIGMVTMFYIIEFLSHNNTIYDLRGGTTITTLMELGGWVIALFSCLFLFYTNAFLMRRRKKEFGLYNILGMGKRHISAILLWETLITSAISLVSGLILGIALAKLSELGLLKVMHAQADFNLKISFSAVIRTVWVFALIFLLLFLNSLRQVRFSTAIALLRSENTNEKPPKANWVIGILGILVLGTGYWLAVSVDNVLSAFTVFFIAVILVIIGTYLIMIAGSVVLCRILQKNKRYYYRPNHFVSVSSMFYRMKRNGAGLASICILATMVLVITSSTTCLYFGSDDALNARYPRDINIECRFESLQDLNDDNIHALKSVFDSYIADADAREYDDYCYRNPFTTGLLQGDRVELDADKISNVDVVVSASDMITFHFIFLSDYNELNGTHETLAPDEALIYIDGRNYTPETINFCDVVTIKIARNLDEFHIKDESGAIISSIGTAYIVVADPIKTCEPLSELSDSSGSNMITYEYQYNFNLDLETEAKTELWHELFRVPVEEYHLNSLWIENKEVNRDDFFSTFGGLFYLGIILSIVFIFAAVLIIYYKQLSEGYEDQSRFDIMQKVGMTKQEIRKSINSQLLTVFYLPLIGAGCHLAFAFPMIRYLLLMFNLANVRLFLTTTVISYVAFAALYMLVYKITTTVYYHIVSGIREG